LEAGDDGIDNEVTSGLGDGADVGERIGEDKAVAGDEASIGDGGGVDGASGEGEGAGVVESSAVEVEYDREADWRNDAGVDQTVGKSTGEIEGCGASVGELAGESAAVVVEDALVEEVLGNGATALSDGAGGGDGEVAGDGVGGAGLEGESE